MLQGEGRSQKLKWLCQTHIRTRIQSQVPETVLFLRTTE